MIDGQINEIIVIVNACSIDSKFIQLIIELQQLGGKQSSPT